MKDSYENDVRRATLKESPTYEGLNVTAYYKENGEWKFSQRKHYGGIETAHKSAEEWVENRKFL